MSVTIDYFYTHISPWAYLGHAAFVDLAKRHGVSIRPRPVDLPGLFESTGGLPLAKRHPARQAYRFVEMQRWSAFRGLPLTLKPKHFPTLPRLADCLAIAVARAGGPVLDLTARLFEAVWVKDQDIADPAVLTGILQELGLDAAALLESAASEAVQADYAANQADAIAQGLIGSPTYILNGEPFWGQDRLDLLEAALVSGRAPYRPV